MKTYQENFKLILRILIDNADFIIAIALITGLVTFILSMYLFYKSEKAYQEYKKQITLLDSELDLDSELNK